MPLIMEEVHCNHVEAKGLAISNEEHCHIGGLN